jgi:hypothetical protein
VSGFLLFTGIMGPRWAIFPALCRPVRPGGRKNMRRRSRYGCFGKGQPDLASAGQLNIKLREKLGIQQRAVQDTVAAINV